MDSWTNAAFSVPLCGASLGLTLGSTKALFAERAFTKPSDLARDEAFWATIRAKYRLKADYINLENGYYCIQPQEVLDAFVDRVREVNLQGSYYMRTRQVDEKLKVRRRLAAMAGCSPDELDHHPQHHRVAGHRDRRLRLEAGRRSGDGRAGLRCNARHVRPPGPAPRCRQPARVPASRSAVRPTRSFSSMRTRSRRRPDS